MSSWYGWCGIHHRSPNTVDRCRNCQEIARRAQAAKAQQAVALAEYQRERAENAAQIQQLRTATYTALTMADLHQVLSDLRAAHRARLRPQSTGLGLPALESLIEYTENRLKTTGLTDARLTAGDREWLGREWDLAAFLETPKQGRHLRLWFWTTATVAALLLLIWLTVA